MIAEVRQKIQLGKHNLFCGRRQKRSLKPKTDRKIILKWSIKK
jgi:hypothetical protein